MSRSKLFSALGFLACVIAIASALSPGQAGASSDSRTTIDPSDPRLVPNPIASSDEGTAWTCRVTGPEVQCTGALTFTWEVAGPIDLCAVPLYSVNGTFTRIQTRYYSLDAASGSRRQSSQRVSRAPTPASWRRAEG